MKKQHNEVTILLVEDDEGHAELTMTNLERSGIANEVMHFTSGERAINYLNENGGIDKKFLMLLDINMPGLDGHQVLGRIKNNAITRKIPVIMLTTAADEREIDRCYDLGCNLYINKPIDYDDFASGVHDLGIFLKNACVPGMKTLVAKHD